jgi:hypothetical protein
VTSGALDGERNVTHGEKKKESAGREEAGNVDIAGDLEKNEG